MSDRLTVAGLQAQLAERDQELTRLRSELAALNAEECDQIAERLRPSEEQARELIRYAPSGIYEIDIRTRRFRSVNDALCTILGYTRDELLTLSPFDLLAEESRAVFADRLRRTLAGETLDPTVEYHVRARGGRLLYAILSTRITYVDGQPDTAFVIAHDVTEHRRVEEVLREQRARLGRLAAELETILAAIADGLVVYDREGRVVRRNAAAEHMLGYSSAQRDMPVQERSAAILRPLHPDGTPFATEDYPINRALRGDTATGEEMILHVPARAGTALRVAVSAAPIRDSGSEIVGAVATFTNMEAFHAVSDDLRRANYHLQAQAAALQAAAAQLEQRVAERTVELTRANSELNDREAVLRYQATILANVSDAVVATDRNLQINFVNRAAERLYGWAAEELIGRYPAQVFRIELTDTAWPEACGRLAAQDLWQGEVVMYRKDGSSFDADGTAIIMKDEAGQIIGYIGVARDITERKQADAALRASREELRAYARRLVEAIEDERKSLARELHDQAGQSVAALKLHLGQLRREVDGQCAERFEEIGQLIEAMMNDLHRLAVNLRPVSLDRYGLLPALEQYMEFFREQSGLRVELAAMGIEDRRLPTEVETTVYRIVQEALTNVLRHAQARRVSVMLRHRDERLTAVIEDDGRGFDVGEALSYNRLGLLGMRERAEMLGGILTIESRPGKGTSIFIEVPV